jgi:hypothetical protein
MARKVSAFNRFFAARRKRGLSAKAIGREWRAKKRGTKSRRKSPRRGNNPIRRNKRVVRKSKNVNVNLVELGGGLVLSDQILGQKGMADLFAGDFRGAITNAANRFRSKGVQEDLIKTGLGIVVIKAAAKSLGERRLGKVGPLVLKV